MNTSSKDQKTRSTDPALLGCLILASIFITAIIAPDIINFKPLPFVNTVDAVTVENSTYIVYQDYKNLYSSIVLVEVNGSTGKVSFNTIASPSQDCITPKIFSIGPDLLISWIQLDGTKGSLCQGTWRIADKTFSSGPKSLLRTDPLHTDYSFDGTGFTLAVAGDGYIDVYTVDRTGTIRDDRNIPISGKPSSLCINGNMTYYAVQNDSKSNINRLDGDLIHPICIADGKVSQLTGWDESVAWLARNGTNSWGYLGYSNSSLTSTLKVNGTSKDPKVLLDDNSLFIIWSEWMYSDWNNRENYEVQLAYISNLSAPKIIKGEIVSYWDGFYSSNAVFADSGQNHNIIWFDQWSGEAIWSAHHNGIDVSSRHAVYDNGNSWNIVGLLITFPVSFGIFGLVFFIVRTYIQNQEPKDSKSFAEISNQKKTKTPPYYSIEFIKYHDKSKYLFLKYWLTILPFVFLGLEMLYYADSGGLALKSRIGLDAIVGNAVILISCLFAILMLRKEHNASWTHRIGILILAGALIIGASSLFLYVESNSVSSLNLIIFLHSTNLLGQTLAIIGPMVILFGLTKRKMFLIPPIIIFSVLGAFILNLTRYSQLQLFLNISSPLDFFYEGMLTPYMISTITLGMLSGVILFKFLGLENIKPLREWTVHDINNVRKEGIVFSLLTLSPMVAGAIYYAITSPFPDFNDRENLLVGIAAPIIFVLFAFSGNPFRQKEIIIDFVAFSEHIIGGYVRCAFAGIAVFISTLGVGVFGLIYLVAYIIPLLAIDKRVRSITPDDLKEDKPAENDHIPS